MKVLNIILSVMILLLAILIAASSYLLFVKREQMVKGWAKMATAVNKAAVELDKGSGTDYAAKLTVASLSHANYGALDGQLAELDKQAKQLIAERDVLAETVRNIAVLAEMKNVPEIDDFRNIEKYMAAREDALKGVNSFKDRRNILVRETVKIAKRVNVNLNEGNLRTGNVADAIKALDTKLGNMQSQFAAYQANIKRVGEACGVKGIDLSDENYDKSLKSIVTAVHELKGALDREKRAAAASENNAKEAKRTVQQRDGQIGSLRATITNKDAEIAQYRKALGIGDDVVFNPWQPGSVEARAAVRGKVVEINAKFGFIALNVGKNSTVDQPLGNRVAAVDPKIANGMEMVVARDMDSAKVEYIGKIRLTNVDGDASIAEVFELAPDKTIKAGDSVYFQNGQATIAAPAAEAK